LSCGELQTIFIMDNTHKKDLSNIVLDKNNETITEVFELNCFFNWNDVLLKSKAIKLFEKRYPGRLEIGNHSKGDRLSVGCNEAQHLRKANK
jgi:hypothetical protein